MRRGPRNCSRGLGVGAGMGMAKWHDEARSGRNYGTKMFIISRLKKLKYVSRRRKIEGIKIHRDF